MRKIAFILAVLFISSASLAFAAEEEKVDPRVEVEGRYWASSLSTSGEVTSDSLISTVFDTKDDLGIDDQATGELLLTIHTGDNSRLRFAYMQISLDGEKKQGESFAFQGTSYPVSTTLVTEIDLKYYKASWVWQFLASDDSRVRFGTLLGVLGFDATASVSVPNFVTPLKMSDSAGMVLPVIGLAFDAEPSEYFHIFAELSGMTGGEYGYMLDGEAGIKITPTKHITISGGYRFISVKVNTDETDAEVVLAGPYAGVVLWF